VGGREPTESLKKNRGFDPTVRREKKQIYWREEASKTKLLRKKGNDRVHYADCRNGQGDTQVGGEKWMVWVSFTGTPPFTRAYQADGEMGPRKRHSTHGGANRPLGLGNTLTSEKAKDQTVRGTFGGKTKNEQVSRKDGWKNCTWEGGFR